MVSAGTTNINVTATGGAGGYMYSLNSGIYQSSSSFSGLVAGNYTMNVKDMNICYKSKTFTVKQSSTITKVPLTFGSIYVNNVTCKKSNDGQITVNVSGGTNPYSYSINDSGVFSNTNTFNNLKAGTYTVYVKDSGNNMIDTVLVIKNSNRPCNKGNNSNLSFRVTAYPNPTVNEFSVKIETESEDKISIDVINMNGVKVFQFNGKINGIYKFGQNLKAGMYFLRVRQGINCSTQKIIKL